VERQVKVDEFDKKLQAIVAAGRVVRPAPDVIRARGLARARATVAAASQEPLPMAAGWSYRVRVAVAASIALLLGAAGAVAALRVRLPEKLAPARNLVAARPARLAALELVALPEASAEEWDAPPAKPRHLPRSATYAAELALLQRAHTAYARRDYAEALAVVGEHGRRFPNGRLAEEREAIRVESLASAGHTVEAGGAAATFAKRFPRSVLLPRVKEAADGLR
jgi:hypothetical protein